MVQLSTELLALLDIEAGRTGQSRSALIREAIELRLVDDRERQITAQIVAGYRAIPPATPDGWGDVTAAGDRAASETALRLDEEERRAGLPPW